MVAVAPFDWQAHDTYFIVAHLHYVLIGGTLLPLFAGLYYYWPLITGKKLSDRLGRTAFWLHVRRRQPRLLPDAPVGLIGMPRRVFTYPAELGIGGLNLASTIGAYLFAARRADRSASTWRSRRRRAKADAQPLERRHARMARAPRRRGLGHPLGPADREPLPDLGPAGLRRRRSTRVASSCPTPRRAGARRSSPRCSTRARCRSRASARRASCR